MMYKHTRADVQHWPDNPLARQALEAYFEKLDQESDAEPRVAFLLDGEGLDFSGADLSGLDLSGATFSQAILTDARLADADLFSAWLIATTLQRADLSRSNLRKVQGRKCDAKDSTLYAAVLDRAEFEDADFRRANLAETKFFSARFPGTDLRDADLRNCTFGQGSRFTAFSEARLAGCRVQGANGIVRGPIDVGSDTPQLLDGAELQRWFADHGAPLVEVWQPSRT